MSCTHCQRIGHNHSTCLNKDRPKTIAPPAMRDRGKPINKPLMSVFKPSTTYREKEAMEEEVEE